MSCFGSQRTSSHVRLPKSVISLRQKAAGRRLAFVVADGHWISSRGWAALNVNRTANAEARTHSEA